MLIARIENCNLRKGVLGSGVKYCCSRKITHWLITTIKKLGSPTWEKNNRISSY